MLLVVGPVFFFMSMIWARVLLELVIAFFRINANVQEIHDDRSGGAMQPAPISEATSGEALVVVPDGPASETGQEPADTAIAVEPSSDVAPNAASSSAPEPVIAPPPVRFCENCGAERHPDGRFCTSCGQA